MQLEQIRGALALDPGNAELQKLKKDIEDMIRLKAELLGQSSTMPSNLGFSSTSTVKKSAIGRDVSLFHWFAVQCSIAAWMTARQR